MGKKTNGEIESFVRRASRVITIEKVILFGSRARGDALKESDWDIIVVSNTFEGMHFIKRMEMLYELWESNKAIDILPYTPEEFETKREEIGIVREAVKTGYEITLS